MTIATAALFLMLQNQAAKASIEGFVVRAGTNDRSADRAYEYFQ
jgi:hypothetical protein